MRLECIDVSGYRQIKTATLNLENNVTILAGANNSGKTSLVELFNFVFGDTRGKLCCDDLSVIECHNWSDIVFPHILTIFNLSKPKEEVISEICNIVFSPDDTSKQLLMPPIEVKLEVRYEKGKDDIREFADYIMEFAPDNTSFYFLYRYAPNAEALLCWMLTC